MKSSKAILFFIVLVIMTIFAAGLHLMKLEQIPENALLISASNEEYIVDIDQLEYKPVTGIRVNGKGEEIPVDGLGISIKELFDLYKMDDYSEVNVVSDDSYSVTLTKDEVDEDGKAYLIIEDEELRLIVFGDTNSKRSVSNVVEIIFE